jgi:cyclopropane fatty-acyl-phospholipid synthase-like methyltransferase
MPVQNNDRFNWALQLMDIKPGNNILEIGCGVGLAVAGIAIKLEDGKITAIDRSQSMIDKAVKRNHEYIKNKRAEFYNVDLFKFSHDRAFDKVFCFNVNVFWTENSVSKETVVIRKHLSKKGLLYILYGPLFAGGFRKIEGPLRKNLAGENFNVPETLHEKEN